MCCMAVTASCEACKEGLSKKEYCKKNTAMDGCGSGSGQGGGAAGSRRVPFWGVAFSLTVVAGAMLFML